ncbi:MAG: GNAT family N-acetyltransferase [Planctomycetota bacterium]|jgi:ribosomal protein S18 acetylase RimI-like enzyme
MMDDFAIRMGTRADAETLAQFNASMAWETEEKRLDLPAVMRGVEGVFADADNGFYVVATDNGNVVGSLLVTYEWSDWRCGRYWWVQSVYVKPECRRRGVFRELYAFVKAKAQDKAGVCGLRLYVEKANQNAQQCYSRMGLEETPYKVYEEML